MKIKSWSKEVNRRRANLNENLPQQTTNQQMEVEDK
jgi:hypothetical protein